VLSALLNFVFPRAYKAFFEVSANNGWHFSLAFEFLKFFSCVSVLASNNPDVWTISKKWWSS